MRHTQDWVMLKRIKNKIVKTLGSLSFVKQISYETTLKRNHIRLIIIYDHDYEDHIVEFTLKASMELSIYRSLDIMMDFDTIH